MPSIDKPSAILPGDEAQLAHAVVIDSVTWLDAAGQGRVVVVGSHGGIYSAYLAAKAGARAAVFNDAGVGRDRAGIAGLGYLADLGIPAAAVDCGSARIGDGRDCAQRGVLSHVNGVAFRHGCRPGQTAVNAAGLLAAAQVRHVAPPPAIEARHALHGPWGMKVAVWALDSASLARPDDAGAILVTGSHGGLLGGNPSTALKVDARAALFSDATGGIDDAGFSRLPALDARSIAAATVDAMRARIGDGRSTFEDGVLSRVNATAAARGAVVGMTARAFVALMAA